MDNLAKANRYFERKAYFPCGIDVDALPEGAVRIALKRLLGMAYSRGAMQYLAACKEEIKEWEQEADYGK